ncbi:ABC transporter ATP-binding protein [Oricola thermophila]|uniref:ABC transporter ATP-binding protein n=1 Tax=Oricola thermophila TaxID=2742145 RepID=A0A6N1V894_9HYPH|nr:ABC transporter ATP-binding protein [Oricola thermophila]QKV17176.1 ABC transporter ATP-binding protein [Oricola thermophila]
MRILLEGFTKRFDKVTVVDNMNLEIRDGEMLALLGPSGCGKSTTLFAICGIHRIDSGRILFGERDVTNLPSQKRNVGVVFQSYALYPHMSVFENIAFPLKVRKFEAADIDREVRAIADLTHIGPLLERKPAQLSGGQQQRVALARALVRKPDVLLLDEPLANLDAKLRLEMRSEIRRIQLETGITAVLVTHDQVEAMSMSDRIAIMGQGEILQIATPDEMYHRPCNTFVAGFLGNPPIAFLEGTVTEAGRFRSRGGVGIPLPDRLASLPEGKAIQLGIRPEFFGNEGDFRLAGKVSFVELQGRETHYDVVVAEGELLRSIQPAGMCAGLGEAIEWPLDTEKLLIFDEDGVAL